MPRKLTIVNILADRRLMTFENLLTTFPLFDPIDDPRRSSPSE